MAQLITAPTIGIIDENGLVTLQWNLPDGVDPNLYDHWQALLTVANGSPTPYVTDAGKYSFEHQLPDASMAVAINMTAIPSAAGTAAGYNSSPWDTTHNFPNYLDSALVRVDNPTPDKGEPVTISFPDNYTYTGTSWRVLFQDGSYTAWMPTSVKTVAKAFSDVGQQALIIEVNNDYSLSNPAVHLRRQAQVNIYVNDKQYITTSSQGDVTGNVGIVGTQGFEIANAKTSSRAPYEVILRGIVRDTVTNELKLLVATSRYSSASSLFGTMAADVFPLVGRPHVKELLEIAPGLSPENASTTPLMIESPTFGKIYVGRPVPAGVTLGGYDPINKTWAYVSGGTPPYAWYADNLPTGLKLSMDGTLSGTPLKMGLYPVNFSVKDSSNPENIATETITLDIDSDLKITSDGTLPTATVNTPYTGVNLNASGGVAPYKWEQVTPWQTDKYQAVEIGVRVSQTGEMIGIPVSYNSTVDFTRTYRATIQVTDAIGAKVSKSFVIGLQAAPLTIGDLDQQVVYVGEKFRLTAPVFGGSSDYTLVTTPNDGPETGYALVDGRIEFTVIPTPDLANKSRTVTFVVRDSANKSVNASLSYSVKPSLGVAHSTASFDHLWTKDDTASVMMTTTGVTNFGLHNDTAALDNGLSMSFDAATNVLTVSGPPNKYENADTDVTFGVMRGTTEVASVTRRYSFLSFSADNGITTTQRPFYLGDSVCVNPLKPSFNSPTFSKTSLATSGVVTVRVQANSKLPAGLSLDINTGLVYGTLDDVTTANTVLEYINNNLVVGTCTLNWVNVDPADTLIESMPDAVLQVPYTGTLSVTNKELVRLSFQSGRLPNGLSYKVENGVVKFSGAPLEAGYFDIWFSANDSDNNLYTLYKRFAVGYVPPLMILTSAIDSAITGVDYSFQLQGFGGVAPYTWAVTGFPNQSGDTLTLDPATGIISGKTFAEDKSGWTLNISLTDSRTPTPVTVSKQLTLSIDNTLRIITTSLPKATLGQEYDFVLQAAGGTPPYKLFTATFVGGGTWPEGWPAPTDNPPPFNTTTGELLGTTTITSNNQTYDKQISFTVQDSSNVVSAIKTLELVTSPGNGLTIDTSNVKAIYRGIPYYAGMTVNGGMQGATYTWSVSHSSPNQLPTGLSLDPNSGAISGNTVAGRPWVSATAYGTGDIVSKGGHYYNALSASTGADPATTPAKWHDIGTDIKVNVRAIDNVGNTVSTQLSLTTASALAISTASLPSGTVTAPYPTTTLTATGYPTTMAATLTWAITSGSLPSGMSLNTNTGQIYGSTNVAANTDITFQVTDIIGDTATKTLNLLVQNTDLRITTTSPLPVCTAGKAYTQTLSATGGNINSTHAYKWSITSGSLPQGLNLQYGSNNVAQILGTTYSGGDYTFTVRVTDDIGAFNETVFVLSVTSSIKLYAGPDYLNSTTTGYLGHITASDTVDTISPRNNKSFYLIATGLISTSTSQVSVTVSGGLSAIVESISGGVAYIRLSGNFNAAATGENTLSVTIKDNGVSFNGTLKWVVDTQRQLKLTPNVSTFGLLEKVAGQVTINNNNSGETTGFYFPMTVDKASAVKLFSLTNPTNTTYQDNGVGLSYSNPSYLLSYNGTSPFTGYVSATDLTISQQDLAWYGASKGFDIYGTGVNQRVTLNYYIMPTVASIYNSNGLSADNQQQQVVVNFSKPMPPAQQLGLNWSFSTSGSTGNWFVSASPNYSSNWLTGFTVTVNPPVSSSGLSASLNLAMSGPLTYLKGSSIVTETVTYFNGSIGTLNAGAGEVFATAQSYGGFSGGGWNLSSNYSNLGGILNRTSASPVPYINGGGDYNLIQFQYNIPLSGIPKQPTKMRFHLSTYAQAGHGDVKVRIGGSSGQWLFDIEQWSGSGTVYSTNNSPFFYDNQHNFQIGAGVTKNGGVFEVDLSPTLWPNDVVVWIEVSNGGSTKSAYMYIYEMYVDVVY